jgi:hypothetical protein
MKTKKRMDQDFSSLDNWNDGTANMLMDFGSQNIREAALYSSATSNQTQIQPTAAPSTSTNISKVFQHWADGDAAAGSAANWNNNILSNNKSDYFEGEVIPHVFVYKASNQTPLVNGQSYSFNITYNYYQANTNAGGFAYMTTFDVSRDPGLLLNTEPTADGSFTNGGGTQGSFYTVGADITAVSNVTYTGSGTKDAHVTVTFTYTGATTTSGNAEIYFGLLIASPGQVPDQGAGPTNGASAWTGGSLQTTVDIGGSGATSIQLSPSAIIAGEISGMKFNDVNGDGVRDANGVDNVLGNNDDEVGLAGWTIFLDKDGDGVLDQGETSTLTAADGTYSFSVTPDADKSDADNDPYLVREVNQSGWTRTSANPAPITITSVDPTEENVNFGNQQQLPSLNITKDATVPGGTANVAGEKISYTISVANTGNTTLTGVTVTDPYADANSIVRGNDVVGNNDANLDVGETWGYTAQHTVTQAEIDSNGGGDGLLENIATADSNETGPDTDDASVPVGYSPSIDVEKYVSIDGGLTWLDADAPTGPYALPASDIQFKFVVTNTGNVTLNNVTLSDSDFDLNGAAAGTNVLIASLAPSGTSELIYTDASFEAGQHTDTATVTVAEMPTVTDSDNANYFGFEPITVTGNPQFNFPNDLEKIQPKLQGQGDSFIVNPMGYISWDMYTPNTALASINLNPATYSSDYAGLTISIKEIWNSSGTIGGAGQAVYRIYVANDGTDPVQLLNSADVVNYDIVASNTNKGMIDLINADPLIGNFNSFSNIENAIEKASNGFQTNQTSFLGTSGDDKVWASSSTTGTAFDESAASISGGDGEDAIYGRNNATATGDSLNGGAGNDMIEARDGGDVVNGNDGNDILFGSLGSDQLYGGAGNDILFGGYGADQLTGGGGSDIFVVRMGDADTIMDFDSSVDQIHVWADNVTSSDITFDSGLLYVNGVPVVQLIGVASLDANDVTVSSSPW